MKKEILDRYLNEMRSAQDGQELENIIQREPSHSFRGAIWNRICDVRIEVGLRIVDEHPLGHLVPRFVKKSRTLTLCGRSYKVPRGGNSTGVRYSWHYAGEWAKKILQENGISVRASHLIWDTWNDYPHRALEIIEEARAGKHRDPRLNRLYKHKREEWGRPINYTVEQNNADKFDKRATRPCKCGGTLFDWGAGWSLGFDFINWHCNKCPDVFTMYCDDLGKIRRAAKAA